MSRLWPIVRREYVERVRSKAFLISTVAGPVLMLACTTVPALLEARQTGRALRVAVYDETGEMGGEIEHALSLESAHGAKRFEVVPFDAATVDPLAALQGRVIGGTLDGYIRLPKDVLAASHAEYHARNVNDFAELARLERVIRSAVQVHRLESEGVPPERVAALTRPFDLKTLKVSRAGEREDRGGAFFLAFFMALMLYMTVLLWGQALMNGVIEEKSNRAVEVMLASVPPTLLFMGKILGIGAVGLTQFGVWALGLGVAGALGAPHLASAGLLPEVPPGDVAALALFFVLGYFLYAALYAAIGASVNTQQEAQSLAFPVATPMILSFLLTPAIVSHPEAAWTTLLSLVPPLTPILMFARIVAQTPPPWQIALSVVLLLATIVLVNWAAARIYRVGILMYGKRPTLPEILKWVGDR
jgi:ABC-2 type transport system permease protein